MGSSSKIAPEWGREGSKMTQPTIATPTPFEAFERAVSARRCAAEAALSAMADALPMEGGYVRGEVPRAYLEEVAKASLYDDPSVTAEAAALQLGDYAETAGLGAHFFVDEYNSPGDVDLRVEGLSCTLMVQAGPGCTPAYVIDGVGGWEQPDPWDARRWREIFQEVKEAFDAS